MRSVVVLVAALLALAGGVVAVPAPALAQVQRRMDGYPVHAANLDTLAGELVARKILEPGQRVYIAPPDGKDADLAFVHGTLVGGLMRRGVIVFAKEAGAVKSVEWAWLRESHEALGELRVIDIGGRPDPSTKIRNRVILRVLDLQTGVVQFSDMVVSETYPYAGTAPAAPVSSDATPSPSTVGPISAARDLQGVGLSLSWLAGSGVTYRHWSASGLGLQVAGIPWFQTTGNHITGFANFGLAGMGTLLKSENFRAFWILGYGVYHWRKLLLDGTLSTGEDHGLAPGLGVDFFAWQNVAIHAGIAYTVSYKVVSGFFDKSEVGPGGQVGLFYYF